MFSFVPMPSRKRSPRWLYELLEFIKEKEVNVLAKNFKFQLFLEIITEVLVDGEIR